MLRSTPEPDVVLMGFLFVKHNGLKKPVSCVQVHILLSIMELHGPKVPCGSDLLLGPTREISVQMFLNAVLSTGTCLTLDGELWGDVSAGWKSEKQLIEPNCCWDAPVLLSSTKEMYHDGFSVGDLIEYNFKN